MNMDNEITGTPNAWRILSKNAKKAGLYRNVGLYSGLLSGQQYVKKTALVSLGIGIAVGVFIGWFIF